MRHAVCYQETAFVILVQIFHDVVYLSEEKYNKMKKYWQVALTFEEEEEYKQTVN